MILSKGGYEYKCANEGAEVVANGIISTVQVRSPSLGLHASRHS